MPECVMINVQYIINHVKNNMREQAVREEHRVTLTIL